MSKKSGKLHLKKLQGLVQDDSFDDEFDDEFEDEFEDELEMASHGWFDDEWDEEDGVKGRFSSRRKIERRRDMKKVYSELEEWDQSESDQGW